MRGQNPRKKFYIAVFADNSDGSMSEITVALDTSDNTFDDALYQAKSDVLEYSGEVYIYELTPVAKVTEENKRWPSDDLRWAAQRAIMAGKPK